MKDINEKNEIDDKVILGMEKTSYISDGPIHNFFFKPKFKGFGQYRFSVMDAVFNVLNYFLFTLFTLACIFPFYYLFINTISDNSLTQIGAIKFYPVGIHFENYLALVNRNNFV